MNSHTLKTSIAMLAVFILGLIIGHYGFPDFSGRTVFESSESRSAEDTAATGEESIGAPLPVEEGSVVVDTSRLSDGQRAMLTALGIDADTIVVTPEMVACAETAVGPARAEEIKNGATPTIMEGARLVGCYK